MYLAKRLYIYIYGDLIPLNCCATEQTTQMRINVSPDVYLFIYSSDDAYVCIYTYIHVS